MHSIVVGIGRDNYLVVPEVLDVVFDSERGDQQVELFVLGHLLAAFLVAVDGLAPEREHCLAVRVARLGDGSARRVALGDEYRRVLDVVLVLRVDLLVVVVAAVAQLLVVDAAALVALAHLLLDSRDFLALLLRGLYLLLYGRDYLLVYAQVVVEVLGYEVVDVGPDGGADLGVEHSVLVGLLPLPHIVGAELGLGLAFEVGLLYLYADGPDYALAAVGRFVVLLEEVLEGLGYCLPEGREMGASVAGVLPVDEGGDVLAVGIAVAAFFR